MQQTSRREEIAANVRAAKARRRVTDAEIGAAIGLGRPAVTQRMNGQARWQVEELEALTKYLEVSLEQLLAPATAEAAS